MWNGASYARPDEEGHPQAAQLDAISALTSISAANHRGGFPGYPPNPYHNTAMTSQFPNLPPQMQPPPPPDGYMNASSRLYTTNGGTYGGDDRPDEYAEQAVQQSYPYHPPSAGLHPHHHHHHHAPGVLQYAAYPDERHFSDEDDDEEDEDDVSSSRHTEEETPIVQRIQERGKPMALQQAIVANDGEAPPRGKPEAMARALALIEEKKSTGNSKTKKKATTTPRKRAPKKAKAKKEDTPKNEFRLGDAVPELTEEEYLNLEDLMKEFCKVPLLAEFSRPVAVLHPEISKTYNSIISQPVDLGHVCRGIRQRKYRNRRDVRLDLWLVFGNCVKYNSHSNNKDAVPSFVSIALHLREYLNNLWQEFMIPSDLILEGSPEEQQVAEAAFETRARDRKRRVESSGVLIVSRDYVGRIIESLAALLRNGGRVDRLDRTSVLDESNPEIFDIIQRINEFSEKLQEFVQSEDGGDLQLESLYGDLKRTCFGDEQEIVTPTTKMVFGRLDRWFWKIATPLHEANCRGVAQSSIWGNIAACIWARESGKKPYWPALCLGILPPAEQRETWHDAVTERNECRLPDKLRAQLQTAKRRCELAQKRQSQSYFLVEFLGSHEFIWIKEADIIEEFDPENDPNKNVKTTKKGRPSRTAAASVTDNKTYQKALQECLWANLEYENVLSDALKGDDGGQDDGSDDGVSFSYATLSRMDEDAGVAAEDGNNYGFDEDAMSVTDFEDLNYILAHDGLIDPESLTRKGGKNKKKAAAAPKNDEHAAATTTKSKNNKEAFNELMNKKQQKEAEKRRKKRSREREKLLKAEDKRKRRRSEAEGVDLEDYDINFDKRARATIIAKAYLMRLKDKNEVKSFALSGVTGMPVASVDSIGLLGMTLAFRAASGMLRMPDEGAENESKRCPWKDIDTTKVKPTSERTALLKKKLELMKTELERVQKNSEKRRSWIEISQAEHDAAMAQIDMLDKTARQNPFKKKKKAVSNSPKPKSPTPKLVPSSPDGGSDNSVDMSSAGVPVSEVEAIATNDADDSSMPDEDEEVEATVLDD